MPSLSARNALSLVILIKINVVSLDEMRSMITRALSKGIEGVIQKYRSWDVGVVLCRRAPFEDVNLSLELCMPFISFCVLASHSYNNIDNIISINCKSDMNSFKNTKEAFREKIDDIEEQS
jgi:hypothetical protein